MLSLVLRRLEALQTDLAAIDPNRDADAADRVATMATTLRDVLAAAARPDGAGEPTDESLRLGSMV